LTDQEKALAANNLMFKGAGAAIGDFARTSDGAANKQRILTAELEDMKAALGEGLLPIFKDIVGFVSDTVIPIFRDLTRTAATPPRTEGWGGFFNALKDELSDIVGWIATIPQPAIKFLGLFSDTFKDVAADVDSFAASMHRSSTEVFLAEHASDAHNAALKVSAGLLEDTTKSTEKLGGATKKTAKETDEAAKAAVKLKDAEFDVKSANLSLEQSTHNLALAQREYDEFLRTGGIDMEKGKQAQEELTRVQKETERATLDVAKAQEAVNEALKPATYDERLEANDKAARAQNNLTLAQLDAQDAQEEYAHLVYTGTATQEELTRAWVRADEAARAVHDAERRLGEAQTASNDLARKGTVDSQAYKDAIQVLKDKQDLLKTATDNQKAAQDALNTAQGVGKDHADRLWEATDKLKSAQLDLDQKTWGAQKAAKAHDEALGKTTTSVRTAWGNVVGYTEDLNKIPKNITTTVTYEELYAVPAGTAARDAAEYAKYLKWVTSTMPNADPMPFDMWVNSSSNPNRKRARGGQVTAGMPYIVGEMGPELFIPGRSGTIVPNNAVGAVNITVNGALDPAGVARQIQSILLEEKRRSGVLGLS
jgi:hypothetical protein